MLQLSENFAYPRLKKYVFVFIIIGFFSVSNAFATVTIDGFAFLENQTTHDSIEVYFAMIAPSDSVYTVYTDQTGYYFQEIVQGVYDIAFSKNNYFTKYLYGKSLYVNTTFPDINMIEHTTMIHVPEYFDHIQDAISQAVDGDTILVDPGVYVENIYFLGKSITVGSLFLTTQDTMYISQTVINGNQDGNVVKFCASEDSTSILTGFTIQNGYAHGAYPGNWGGGILCDHSSPKLTNLALINNSAYVNGGGMCCFDNSSPIIELVTISNNWAGYHGGGFDCYYSNPNLRNVTIINNSATFSGGGINLEKSDPVLSKVTICNNVANDYGGGIFSYINSNPSLINCIVSDNIGYYGLYNYHINPGNPSIYYSDFYNNENGNFYNCGEWLGVNVTTNANGDSCDAFYNIQLDPLFVDFSNNDYHLSWTNYPIPDSTMSPCIDAGDPNSPPDPDGTIADMGAYYFNQGVSIDEPEDISDCAIRNFPNPTKNTTTILYSLKKNSYVMISIYNIKGQLVNTLISETKPKGEYSVIYNTEALRSGVYFYKLQTEDKSEIKKMIVIK